MTDAFLTAAGPDEQDDWAAQYVLGTLAASERHILEARLPHDPALRRAVREWEARLLPLTGLAAPAEPSAALWPRIEGTVATVDQPAPRAAAAPAQATRTSAASGAFGVWHHLGLWRWLAGASVAMAAVLATVLVVTQGGAPDAPRYMVVLTSPQGETPGWVIQSRAGQRLSLEPVGPMAAVPPDKSLQFWTKADGWAGPVSLGLVQANQRVEVPVDKLPPLQPNQLFELTLEPAAGSPLNRPTGPILYIGRAVQML
ncbi:MAG: RNA polymerase subunit sigma-70 [Comamonadaceae bacterium]|nr:MAG: RNA polymerase subunit sigma-70 [Comamonadaceae bacterium]